MIASRSQEKYQPSCRTVVVASHVTTSCSMDRCNYYQIMDHGPFASNVSTATISSLSHAHEGLSASDARSVAAWAAARNMSYFELEQHFWTRMNEPGQTAAAAAAASLSVVFCVSANGCPADLCGTHQVVSSRHSLLEERLWPWPKVCR